MLAPRMEVARTRFGDGVVVGGVRYGWRRGGIVREEDDIVFFWGGFSFFGVCLLGCVGLDSLTWGDGKSQIGG